MTRVRYGSNLQVLHNKALIAKYLKTFDLAYCVLMQEHQ